MHLLPLQETSLLMVFVSLLNLDVRLDVCYFPGMDTYIKSWLQLAFPTYVFILVVIVIVVSSYSIRFSKLIGNKDPVANLATLILLSYAKFHRICFESLSVGILISVLMVLVIAIWPPDATVSYLNGKHIPLFVVAVLILLVSLIYTALLFFWQWRFYIPRWKIQGRIQGWGIQGTFPPPPLQAQQLPSCTSDLPFVQKMQQMHKISDDLVTISMISDERTIFALASLLAIVRQRRCDRVKRS